MHAVWNWIMANPVMTGVIVVIAIAVIVTIWTQRKGVLTQSALYIVARVEEEWGSDMGKVKFAEAYEYLKHKYPVITFFIQEQKLKDIIEESLSRLKEILATKASKEKKKLEEQEAATATKE